MDQATGASEAAKRAVRDRSPAYPFISLGTAMDRLAAFEKKFGARHPTPADKSGLAWGMKEKSSQAFQTLAALKSFGLVTYEGANEQRVVLLTEEGRNYLRAQQESIKAAIVKQAALRPKAIRSYWARWGADRPINEVCLDQLTLNDGFTDSAATTFLKVYDDTVAFAGLANGDKVNEPDDDAEGPVTTSLGESVEVPSRMPLGAPVNLLKGGVAMPPNETNLIKQDTFTLDEGTAVLQWPAQLSVTSYEDFKDWIELQLRKIKRSIQ